MNFEAQLRENLAYAVAAMLRNGMPLYVVLQVVIDTAQLVEEEADG